MKNDVEQAGRLAGFINSLKDPLGGTLAAATVQTAANVINAASHPDRGFEFLGNVLSGFFHALEGAPGLGRKLRPHRHFLQGGRYRVARWRHAGRALEIALDPSSAFTFLQTVLIDDVFNHLMFAGNSPFFGYISVRVCPPTKTMLGMQQFSPHSVMIEVVSYRSPYANNLMDVIQSKALSFKTKGPKPLLHWGLENDQLTPAYLATTPLGAPFKGFKSKLGAFTAIRNFLAKGHPKAFDNNFSNRLNL